MEDSTDQGPAARLLDAYCVPGFRARAEIDRYDHKPPAFVITLDRRSKKRSVAGVANDARAYTANAGAERATLVAASMRSISISRCVASTARTVA